MIEQLYTSPFPILDVNPQYILREHTTEDADAFFEYYTHPDVGRHILATKPRNLIEAHAEIQYCRHLFYQKKGLYWTIAHKVDNKMIGAIGVYINETHQRGEICYDLAVPYWKKGIMTQVLRVAMGYLFQEVGLVRIEAILTKGNTASIALLKKLGFKREGTLKKYRHYQNAFYDVEMYACINPRISPCLSLFSPPVSLMRHMMRRMRVRLKVRRFAMCSYSPPPLRWRAREGGWFRQCRYKTPHPDLPPHEYMGGRE